MVGAAGASVAGAIESNGFTDSILAAIGASFLSVSSSASAPPNGILMIRMMRT